MAETDATWESRVEWVNKLSAMDKQERDALLVQQFYAFDERFFTRDPGVRGGEVCLRGTRLTVQDVIAIDDADELADYPEITAEQVAACHSHNIEKSQCANDIVRYGTPLRFHTSRGEWGI